MTAIPPTVHSAQAFHVAVPFKRPFETAGGPITERVCWIVRLRSDQGGEGYGEVALDPAASRADERELGKAVREAVEMVAHDRPVGSLALTGVAGRALHAGLDAAIGWLDGWTGGDPHGQRERPSSVAVNATLASTDPAETARAAGRAVADGFTTLKLKVGRTDGVAALVACVESVRAAVGGSIRLRLDANGSWDMPMALARLQALDGLGIEYVEQPLPAGDVEGHAALRNICRVPIALDESVDGEVAAAHILEIGAADVLVAKLGRVGGASAAAAIAVRAAARGVPVVLSSFFETGVGIAAGLRAAADLPGLGDERAHGLATAGLLSHDLLATPLAIQAGRMAVPARLQIDEEALARYTVERLGRK